MKSLPILLAVLLALVVSACGTEQATPTATTNGAEPTIEATPEPDTTDAPEPGATGTPVAIPSIDLNGAPDLAARFPDTVGGQPLMIQSVSGDVYNTMGEGDPAFEEFLDSVGADLDDVSVAFGGIATDPENFLSVAAFRVEGVAEEQLREEFLGAALEEDMEGLTEQNVGGKDVLVATDPTGTVDGVYIYVQDDTVYYLTGSEAQATEILEALP